MYAFIYVCMYVRVLKRTLAQSGASSRLLSRRKRWKKAFLMRRRDHCVFALHVSVRH